MKMRKFFLPILFACTILMISVGLLAYGLHLQNTLPIPRNEFQVWGLLGTLLLGLILFVGSAGYLGAVPGLEMGEKGFKPKDTFYGDLVGQWIRGTTTSCGAGYAFGFTVTALLLFAGIVSLALYALYSFFSFAYQQTMSDPGGAFQIGGMVVGLVMGFVVLWFLLAKAKGKLAGSSLLQRVCPPRET